MQVTENAEWAREQFESCEFGDKRRTERVCKMAINMLERPEGSLVTQNENWKDVKAAYTWCAREEVTFDAVATPHWEQTRLTKPGRYLLISDTTDIDHFHHKATTGLSQLGDGRGQGMQLHSCLVVDAEEKVVLGTAGALLNYRPKASKKESRTARLKRRRESEIWGDVVAQAGAPPAGSQGSTSSIAAATTSKR